MTNKSISRTVPGKMIYVRIMSWLHAIHIDLPPRKVVHIETTDEFALRKKIAAAIRRAVEKVPSAESSVTLTSSYEVLSMKGTKFETIAAVAWAVADSLNALGWPVDVRSEVPPPALPPRR